MKPWDLDTSAAQLRDALDELQIAWRQTTDCWQDPVSQKFCETHLEPIGPALKKALDAVGQMQQLVSQMTRDCEK
jgi:hypothetical protein